MWSYVPTAAASLWAPCQCTCFPGGSWQADVEPLAPGGAQLPGGRPRSGLLSSTLHCSSLSPCTNSTSWSLILSLGSQSLMWSLLWDVILPSKWTYSCKRNSEHADPSIAVPLSSSKFLFVFPSRLREDQQISCKGTCSAPQEMLISCSWVTLNQCELFCDSPSAYCQSAWAQASSPQVPGKSLLESPSAQGPLTVLVF